MNIQVWLFMQTFGPIVKATVAAVAIDFEKLHLYENYSNVTLYANFGPIETATATVAIKIL